MNRRILLTTAFLAVALLGVGASRIYGQSEQPAKSASQVSSEKQAEAPSAAKAQGTAQSEPADPAAPGHSHAPAPSQAPAKSDTPAKPRLSADQAYKANCTRCHSELPKLQPGGMATVLMHMRVRANLPKDEARAILDYLTR